MFERYNENARRVIFFARYANSSETLLACKGLSLIPRIGEAVLIRDEQGVGYSHRVQDVEWEFDNIYGYSELKEVKVRVVKEDVI